MAFVNSTNTSKSERSILFNTLAGVVKNLENRFTTIDLRNEVCVTGKIVKVDAYMNIEMEDVIFYDMRGNQKPLTNFYISSRTIRYIHMPKNADAIKLLNAQLNCMTRKKLTPTKKSFKVLRAERRNLETVRESYQD